MGHHVGYDSTSQFSREYRRQFGLPPGRDAARLRAGGDQAGPMHEMSVPTAAAVRSACYVGSACRARGPGTLGAPRPGGDRAACSGRGRARPLGWTTATSSSPSASTPRAIRRNRGFHAECCDGGRTSAHLARFVSLISGSRTRPAGASHSGSGFLETRRTMRGIGANCAACTSPIDAASVVERLPEPLMWWVRRRTDQAVALFDELEAEELAFAAAACRQNAELEALPGAVASSPRMLAPIELTVPTRYGRVPKGRIPAGGCGSPLHGLCRQFGSV